MPRECVILGMAMPTLIPLFFLSVILLWFLDRHILQPLHVYRKVANPPLFRIAVFAIVFSLAGLCVY